MANVRLLCGSHHSGRNEAIDRLFLELPERTILLAPTQQQARRRAEHLILENGLAGLWGRRVLTFQEFVVWLLQAEGIHATPLEPLERLFFADVITARLLETGKAAALGDAARSSGFLTHLMRVIEQLKQAAVTPEEFQKRICTRGSQYPLDSIVSEAYTAYQDALIAVGAYDRQGLYWEAELRCGKRRPAALHGIGTLLLDGFDDFTPSEFRLLESLAPHLEWLVFGINYPAEEPTLRDVFRVPRATVEKIQETFAVESRTFSSPSPRRLTEFAARHFFWRDVPPPLAGLVCDLELVPCAGFVEELETIARRVKALLLDERVPANEIVVVFRRLEENAEMLRDVFEEFGIPVRVHHNPSLLQSSVVVFLLTFLEATGTWERETVLDVLSSPWFSKDGVSAQGLVDAFSRLSRAARVISGFEEWLQGIDRLGRAIEKRSDEAAVELCQAMPFASEGLELLRKNLEKCKRLADTLPATASFGVYAACLDELLTALDVQRAIAKHPDPMTRHVEGEALRALCRLLCILRTWEISVGAPARVNRADFVRRFRQILRSASYSYPDDALQGVSCVEIETLRNLTFDYVFFAGANEGAVPVHPTANAVYSEEDVRDLQRLGIPLEGRETHTARELLLFHHVLTVPKKHLCVSWHTFGRDGKEARPSPFVEQLLELVREQQGEVVGVTPRPSAFVPEPNKIASLRDLRNYVFFHAPRLKETFPELFQQAMFGAEIEARRHDVRPFDIYDGVLRHPDLIAAVGQRFGEGHLFSVSQLETYAECPFRYFVERALEVSKTDVPAPEFERRVFGSIVHRVLSEFHFVYRGCSLRDIDATEAERQMNEIVNRAFDDLAGLSTNAPVGVAAVEKQRMLAVLLRYLRIERQRDDEAWKPLYFESVFGETREDSPSGLDCAQPFVMNTPHGAVRLAGRIDRIDLAGDEACVIDYKTGQVPTPDSVRTGISVQLPLYALALEQALLPGTACRQAVFLRVGTKKRVGIGVGRSNPDMAVSQETARERVAAYVAGIRAGYFPPTPAREACEYCAARRACRYERSRIERKQEAHEADT
ncbi:MAG: exodeoxyribonuclease V subunit gamma [Candidatus Hydrogenedentes bacterium]|nr:exodeoxyribonuclease V subunit gamma [Candidatus Hydrogenedentota bacterium]